MLNLEKYQNRHSRKSKVTRAVWNTVWLLLFRPTPRGLLYGWRRFLLRLFGAKIGKGVNILPSCKVWQPWNLTMGDHSCLSEDVVCYSVDRITIGAQVVVSQGAFLCCASHDISSPIMELIYKPIVIGPQAWVAARAFIGPGVTVGEGAVVGACSVVTKDVDHWTVVAGNPAKFIKNRAIIRASP
ncbi:MAG: WcaF family extracellular polysaccharide biosynthesis acetyltransferase [bacterium]